MSQKEVEIRNEAVRGFFSAFEDEDDVFRAVLHPEIEWYPIEENRTPNRGIDAALRNRNEWLDTWTRTSWRSRRPSRTGTTSWSWCTSGPVVEGAESRRRCASTRSSRTSDGKVAYIYDHEDRRAAMAAAGLSE
jgi:hypothetical protein